MKTKNFSLFALFFLLSLFTTLFTYAQQPVIAYISITGQKTGNFKGASVLRGTEGKIECVGFRYSVISPRNGTTGQVTGRATHTPVIVTKYIDAATPQLLQAVYTNENLPSVVIEFYKKSSSGQITTPYYKIKLTNASISMISQSGGTGSSDKSSSNTTETEDISFTFQKIEIENPDAKTTAADDWIR